MSRIRRSLPDLCSYLTLLVFLDCYGVVSSGLLNLFEGNGCHDSALPPVLPKPGLLSHTIAKVAIDYKTCTGSVSLVQLLLTCNS